MPSKTISELTPDNDLNKDSKDNPRRVALQKIAKYSSYTAPILLVTIIGSLNAAPPIS